MDEPTNHLDVGSVEALEAAFANWPGALLLVSHDHRFLSRLTTARWEVVVRDARRSDLEPRSL
jgi:ATPase subunit of ABC transporter with duplicated ATPase domains